MVHREDFGFSFNGNKSRVSSPEKRDEANETEKARNQLRWTASCSALCPGLNRGPSIYAQ